MPYSLLAWSLMSLFDICIVAFVGFMILYDKKNITLEHVVTALVCIAFCVAPIAQVILTVLSIGGICVLSIAAFIDWASKIVIFKRK